MNVQWCWSVYFLSQPTNSHLFLLLINSLKVFNCMLAPPSDHYKRDIFILKNTVNIQQISHRAKRERIGLISDHYQLLSLSPSNQQSRKLHTDTLNQQCDGSTPLSAMFLHKCIPEWFFFPSIGTSQYHYGDTRNIINASCNATEQLCNE